MSVSIVASATASAGGSNTSAGVNTVGASRLVVCVGTQINGTLTDSLSNTWVKSADSAGASAIQAELWIADNAIVGAAQTFTYDQASSIIILALNGLAHGAVDQTAVNGTALAATLAPGSITPGFDNEYVITVLAPGNQDAASLDSGFTLHTHVAANGGAGYVGVAFAFKQQTTAAAVNPTWTFTVADNGGVLVASYKTFHPGAMIGLL